ncbi:hypothetical protein H6P81_004050 [Aristolochia fimbriata]|uniref:F-box protein At3g26010-like beta-propeller domain-containing protein n=1 Tax=Aristolochia fimbriata TaxID=158543 RepID=A0AAV7FHP0_ARIFI|nr:hypothetical protein H6P81_004050 [Aristolochia fimbriata]
MIHPPRSPSDCHQQFGANYNENVEVLTVVIEILSHSNVSYISIGFGFFHQRDFVNNLAEFTHEVPRYVEAVTTTIFNSTDDDDDDDQETPTMISLDFLPSYPHLRLVDCCNGLLLCLSVIGKSSTAPFYYYVCNPATKKWLGLPKPRYLSSMPVSEALDFDPSRSPYFKLVLIHSRQAGTLVMVDAYHSQTARWVHSCLVTEVEQVPLHLRWDVPVLLGGFVYKLASKDRLVRVNLTESNNYVGVVSLPSPRRSLESGQVFLGRSGRRLCCAFLEGTFRLRVWSLRDWGTQKWRLKLDHEFNVLASSSTRCNPELGRTSVVAFHPDSPLVFLAVSNAMISFRFGDGGSTAPEVVCGLKRPAGVDEECEEEEFRACLYTPCLSDFLHQSE